MNGTVEENDGAAAAMSTLRFANQDRARLEELDRLIAAGKGDREPGTCSKGHPLDGVKADRGRTRTYCKACNRVAMAEQREAERSAGLPRGYRYAKAGRAA